MDVTLPTSDQFSSTVSGGGTDTQRSTNNRHCANHHSVSAESGGSQRLAAVSNVPTQNPSPWNTHCIFLQCTCGFWRVVAQHSETRRTPIDLLGIFKCSEVDKSEENAWGAGGGNPGWCNMSDTAEFKAINLQSRLLMQSVRLPTDSWRQ